MKKKLRKKIGIFPSNYGWSFSLFTISLLTNKVIFGWINEFFIGKGILLINKDLDFFYVDQFNNLVFMAFGIVAAIIIPVFISLFEKVKGENQFSVYYIKKHYNFDDLFFMILIITCSIVSQFFIVVLFLYFLFCSIVLIKIRSFFNLIFNNTESFKVFLMDELDLARTTDLKFDQMVKDMDEILRSLELGEQKLTEVNKILKFDSANGVIELKKDKLRNWISEIKTKVETLVTYETLFTVQEEEFINMFSKEIPLNYSLYYDSNLRYISLIFSLDEQEDVDLIIKAKRELDNFYENKNFDDIFTFSPVVTYEGLFENLDVYIATTVKQNNLIEFKRIFNLFNGILEEVALLSDKLFETFSALNYEIFIELKDFEKSNLVIKTIFEFWERLLFATANFPNKKMVRYPLIDLSNAIDNNIFDDDYIDKLDDVFTRFYRRNKFTSDYVFNYVYGIISISISLIFSNFNRGLRVIELIKYLKEDIENKKSWYKEKYNQEEKEEILVSCRQGLMLFVFYYINNNQNTLEILLENRRKILKLIDSENIFSDIQFLFLNEFGRWNVPFWGRSKFNRHGVGTIIKFSTLDFLVKGLVIAIKESDINVFSIKKFEIHEDAFPLFETANKMLDISKPYEKVIKEELEKKIDTTREKNRQLIIDSDLVIEKLNDLAGKCLDVYLNEPKLSRFNRNISYREVSETGSFSINILLEKRIFISNSESDFSGLSSLGKYLAIGENKRVVMDFKKKGLIEGITQKIFYREILPEILKTDQDGKVLVFCGNKNHFSSRAFSLEDGRCFFNGHILKITRGDKEEIDQVEIKMGNQVRKIFLIEADELENDYFLFFKPDDFSIDYYLDSISNTDLDFIKDNNLHFKFDHFAQNPSLVKEIINKKQIKFLEEDKGDEEKVLMEKIGLQIYVTPKLNIRKENTIRCYELPFPDFKLPK